jgi:GTPase
MKCGLVAILGAPNAGKSTLVNALVGQKVAIVSPKAQTTRVRLMGIAIEGETQILLVDTPGIFEGKRRFDRAMVQAAWGGTQDADMIVLLIDAKGGLGPKVEGILKGLESRSEPKLLVLNKVDVADHGKMLRHITVLTERLSFVDTLIISATTGDGVADLKTRLAAAMTEGPWHFPADQISDATDRVMAAEITHQQILVARDSQRAIVLGKGGARLKEIGSKARAELAVMLATKVHLYLHVKVSPKWDENREVYRDIGLDWVE